MKKIAAGLPGTLVIPEGPDSNVKQRVVDDLDPNPNDEFRAVKEGSPKLEPVDPFRREQEQKAIVYDSLISVVRKGIWLFPLLGVAIIVWRKMETARIRRVLETVAREEAAKEVPDVPAPPA
jgi:hypothetical protein